MPRVLVVDDPRDPRHEIATVLRNAGYEVELTLDGEEGLARARGWAPDVIMLDVHQSGGRGFEALERLRRDPATRAVPVVLLTTEKPSDELIVRGLHAGAFDFLGRSCSAAEMIARVGVMARIKRAHDELAAFASTSDALLQTLDPLAMCDLFVEQARQIFRAEAVLLALEFDSDLPPRVGVGLDPTRPEWQAVLDALFSSERSFAPGGPVTAREIGGAAGGFLKERGLERLLGTEVRSGEAAMQLVVMAGGSTGFTRDADRRLLESLARQARIALDNALLHATKRRQAAELERAIGLRSRFFAAVSHELRTPINALLGYNELLRGGAFGELTRRQKEAIDNVGRAADHLLGLINDVLDLSRIEAGKLEVSLQDFDLPELLVDAVSVCRPDAEDKGLVIEVDAPDRLGMTSDPHRLRQILLNLTSNAVKFTEEGTVRIEATVVAEGDAPTVRIVVSDTGPGIPEEDRERIFEEFEQAASGTAHGGTGLGLPISRRLAELLGGRLELEPGSGPGSTFCLTLPLGISPEAAPEEIRML